MKRILISFALAVVMLALNLQAQTTVSWKAATSPSNNFWNVAANWSPARVPGVSSTNTGDKADFNSSTYPPCFLTNFALPAQFMLGDNGPGFLYILNGGTLASSNYAGGNSYNAISYNHISRVDVRSGGSLISSNHLWVGLNLNARGNLVLNGGTATVLGMIGLGWSGGIGIAQVNGGSMNLAQWNDTASISPLSQLDIRAGAVYITNDHTASIASYIAGGQLTGYGGVGTVHYTYDTNNNCTIVTATATPGAGGPYPPTAWPTNINPNLFAHYWSLDPNLIAPNANWINSLGLIISSSGDQATTDQTFRGLAGKQATGANLNIYDQNWHDWNTNGLIDILVSVYGDANILRSALDPNQCRRFQFLEGTLPTDPASTVYGNNLIPTNAFNSKWNWMLFTITNSFQTNLLGDRQVGSIKTNATGTYPYGGINGGTIRLQGPDGGMLGITIRAAAFGQHGVFGTAPDINQFEAPDGSCPAVLDKNLVGIDLNAGQTNYLQVINDASTGQDVTYVSNIGPSGDKRKAVIPNGSYLNFGIISNYLGQPCNDNVTMKVCVDYYDDPALVGTAFGPNYYASDNLGDITDLYSSRLIYLQGTGKWLRQSWAIQSVNLLGVNTAPLTGGPQFVSLGGQVPVSRVYLAALRGAGPLAGQDPLADCYPDPNVCFGVYGNYAELDLAHGVMNGVDVGNNSGDQGWVEELAGPPSDQRISVCSTSAPNYYLNFQILTNALGPITQGNLDLAMTVTYYDDPAAAGFGFRPEVWSVQQFGTTSMLHMSNTKNMVVQGTGKWRDAYWEIGSISLNGVNQSPAAARFTMSTNIHISRIRYTVIRPCGPTAGQNLLSNPVRLTAAPDPSGQVQLTWPYRAPQAALQGTPAFGTAWSAVAGTPTIQAGTNSVLLFSPATADSQFFRLNLTPQ
jgi:hypothetical protein